MTSRFRLALIAGAIALTGCGDSGSSPLRYSRSDYLTETLKAKPKLRAKVLETTSRLFGPTPDQMRVPVGAGLPEGGARLAAQVVLGEEKNVTPKRLVYRVPGPEPGTAVQHRLRGGYSLYRQHCMHCHGASGDGRGPTAPFLWPPPRDYRMGIFKFTSTTGSGPDSKPTREDLKRTLREGIPNTSMPSFESLLTSDEIEQVIDYVIFLSMRGEVERGLVYLVAEMSDEEAKDALPEEDVQMATEVVFNRWKNAESTVLNPKVPRVPATAESIARGKALFLGQKGLQCYGCHGLQARGDGDSFVSQEAFNKAVFEGNSSRDQERIAELKKYAEENNKKWGDEWGDALRPANLRLGYYKGGRRPIDLYWRIAKGINGTPMPAHLGSQLQTDEEVWDLVNFVLALPYEPGLLDGAVPAPPVAGAPAVAQRNPAESSDR